MRIRVGNEISGHESPPNHETESKIIIHGVTQQDIPSSIVQELQEKNTRLQREIALKESALIHAQEEKRQVEEELTSALKQLGIALRQLNEREEISVQDLTDYESEINDLKMKIEELQEELREEKNSHTENSHDYEEKLNQKNQQAEEFENQYRQLKEEVGNIQKEIGFEPVPGELTIEYLNELQEEISRRKTQMEELKKQLTEAEHDEGAVFEQLQELNLRHQQDMKYVEFFEKVPEKKIDGLELFRSQVRKLNEELTDILKNGLQKAYVFKGNHLIQQAEENKEEFERILSALHNLVEDYEPEEINMDEAVLTTEEYKKQAEEQLEKLEKTIRDMYQVSEKFLRIKNVIGFDFS